MIVKGIHYNDSVESHCQVFSLTLVKIIGCLGKTLFNSTINDRGNMIFTDSIILDLLIISTFALDIVGAITIVTWIF